MKCTMGDVVEWAIGGGYTVSCQIRDVSPAVATAWLKHEHPRNRQTPRVWEKYAEEMVLHAWVLTPEPIIFDSDGLLVNGGNRLRAIETLPEDESVPLTIWRGFPPETFLHLDRGKQRSVFQADMIAGQAHPKELYPIARATVVLEQDASNFVVSDESLRRMAALLSKPWGELAPIFAKGTRKFRVGVWVACCLYAVEEPCATAKWAEELVSLTSGTLVDAPSSAVQMFYRWYTSQSRKSPIAYRGIVNDAAATIAMLARRDEVVGTCKANVGALRSTLRSSLTGLREEAP